MLLLACEMTLQPMQAVLRLHWSSETVKILLDADPTLLVPKLSQSKPIEVMGLGQQIEVRVLASRSERLAKGSEGFGCQAGHSPSTHVTNG